MIDKINENESEEHLKNIISDFLKETWYKENYEINTKERNDLVIYSGKSSKEPAAVIIEVKRPTNKPEMVSEEKPNSKALHELILYYLRERIDHGNIEIKHLIVTNIYEWFIIDENWFEKNVFRNARLKKDYENWKVSGKDTRFFYDSIAKPFLDVVEEPISCVHVNLKEVEKNIDLNDEKKDSRIIPYYKILSPVNLLKQPFKNDSNTLDKDFYLELLHLIGLEEHQPDTGKRTTIQRKDNPNDASLIENTISKLKRGRKLRNIDNLTSYGTTEDEQLFNISLELCITWINRILFLKLLEAQLYNYHKGNRDYLFLNDKKVFDFDQLNNLFFDILAEKNNRPEDIKELFSKVPYLNSSLFDRTVLESQTLEIGNLDNRLSLPLYNSTVLKDSKGKRKTSSLHTLEYLLAFLDAYDFTSEGSEEIQEENKNLINASVLGLIFEKINGYKEGSYFTPGFVTMFICKEAIRNAVISKFNNNYEIECSNIPELKNFLSGNFKPKDILEYNKLINEIKICDPAVGSGHFLVSALNEIIAIKSELGILADSMGSRLTGYEVKVENDELIVTFNDNSEIFEYTITNQSVNCETQRVQKTLFHEKEKIIEDSLFGVDINQNSVKICRLRLWIELLKSAYYTEESRYRDLETLPNIDINIKCGNSLISRFELTDELHSSFEKAGLTLQEYKEEVQNYKLTKDKNKKEKILEIIEKLKSFFQTSLDEKFIKKISKARGRVTNLESETNRKKQWQEEITADLEAKLKKAKQELKNAELKKEDILGNAVYANSFEWRFEFPEILEDSEAFKGFDVIIGNPPYIPLEDFEPIERDYFRERYSLFERKFETSVLFMSSGLDICTEHGVLAFIAPVTWQTGENYGKFREFLFRNGWVYKIINLPFNVFPGAYVDTAIYFLQKAPSTKYEIYSFKKKEIILTLDDIPYTRVELSLISAPKYKVVLNPFAYQILRQSKYELIELGQITISTQGLSGSSFKDVKKANEQKHFPFLAEGNVYNYMLQVIETYYISLEDRPSLKPFYEASPKLLIRRIVNRQDRLSVAYTNRKMVFKKDINPFVLISEDFDIKFLQAYMASRLISFIYLNTSSIAGKDDFRQTTLAELREIPIPVLTKEQQQPFVRIADYILLLAAESRDYAFFERIIDALLYEIFFENSVKQAGCEISPTLKELPLLDSDDKDKSIKIIEHLYKDLSNPKHIISTILLKLLNIHEISIVEGRKT
jgi:hypothetical protein